MNDDHELRRRTIEGLAAEVSVFGSGAPGSRVVRRDGLLASVCPATPDRSLFNGVCYADPERLEAGLDELAGIYERAGVSAWTVWVPGDDRKTAALLERRGHVLDAEPRAMALWLSDLAPAPPAPEGIGEAPGTQAVAARLNDLAYGFQGSAFAAALAEPTEPPLRWSFAVEGTEPVACAATVDVDDDCCVTGVATLPGHQRRGIAAWLLHRALVEARARGMSSASLQSTKAGARVYESLGFRDLGAIEMWERRSPA